MRYQILFVEEPFFPKKKGENVVNLRCL